MRRDGWIGKATLALALLALALIGVIWGAHLRKGHPPARRPRLLTAFLDVGTGDCTLIRSPDGHATLVDAGPAAAGPIVAQTLRREGIRSLDLLVLAGPASGSLGGVPGLLDNGITVARVWDNNVASAGEARQAALRAIHERDIAIQQAHQGDQFLLGTGGVRLSVLWPPEHGPRSHTDALVCRLDYGDTGLVLAGPADGVEEGYLVANAGGKLACDVLQVAANGADSATSSELLRRAAPTWAVISSGPGTPPGAWTLHRLEAAGAEIWRTDTQGAITIYADGREAPVVKAPRM